MNEEKEKFALIHEHLRDLELRLIESENRWKSIGLKLAGDWGLFFMRPSVEQEDELFLDMQLGMVIILFTTWQLPHGYGFYPETIEKELAPHKINRDEIQRVIGNLEKAGLVEKDERLEGYYVLTLSVCRKSGKSFRI